MIGAGVERMVEQSEKKKALALLNFLSEPLSFPKTKYQTILGMVFWFKQR